MSRCCIRWTVARVSITARPRHQPDGHCPRRVRREHATAGLHPVRVGGRGRSCRVIQTQDSERAERTKTSLCRQLAGTEEGRYPRQSRRRRRHERQDVRTCQGGCRSRAGAPEEFGHLVTEMDKRLCRRGRFKEWERLRCAQRMCPASQGSFGWWRCS